jgi:tRNA nucleotidyltransferase (CCA-adding enzyme)
MADYIYTMESRLSPAQLRTVNLVQDIARSHGMNVYLTGGAIRDILTGFPISDLDFTVQGNPLELQQEVEKSGGVVDMVDPAISVIHAIFQATRTEISMARAEVFDQPGKPPLVTSATINEDLRRRDFTCNAMALSLNEGSRGLLLDPFNGAADIEARLIRVLHSYAFLEDPSRLIRAIRFATRFGWDLEERTRARYDSAREGEYIQFIGSRAIGYEIEQIAHEENPIAVMKALESEGWLKVLCPKWLAAKADVPELAQLLKTRATMAEFNLSVDAAPAIMHFLTMKLGDAEIAAIQRLIPHREFVAAWQRLEHDAKDLSRSLLSKEAALNSGAWKILSSAKPEALLYLDITGRNKAVDEKIKNFFGKWRQYQDKLPLAQMAELRITPQLPEYSRICQEAFLLLLDGKLRSDAEIMNFLAPFEPPQPPPPPTPVRRGRAGAKKAAAPAAKAAVQDMVPAVIEAAASTGPASSSAEVGEAGVEEKRTARRSPASAKKAANPASTSEMSVVAKHPSGAIRKPTAKPAEARPGAVKKAVAKATPRKASTTSRSGKAAVTSDKRSGRKPAARTLLKKAPEKKKHHEKKDKPGKKKSKRR